MQSALKYSIASRLNFLGFSLADYSPFATNLNHLLHRMDLKIAVVLIQMPVKCPTKCLRPYHDEYTRSRLITEVKHRRARIVLGWVTAWELLVP